MITEQDIAYPDLTIFWYMAYQPAKTRQGDIIGVSYNATDISERVRQEKRVKAQNESLQKITFIQSHELRRPVSSILGLMELIKDESYFNEQREELVLLELAVKELDQTISKIMNYTRLS